MRRALAALAMTAASAATAGKPRGRPAASEDACGGVSVYVYRDLPSAFPQDPGVEMLDIAPIHGRERFPTKELGVPCDKDASHACHNVEFWGRGKLVPPQQVPPRLANSSLEFHATLQNALPWMMVGHLLAYCAVDRPENAQLFFLPYPVVSLLRASGRETIKPHEVDENYAAVKDYLRQQPAWQRCNGCDHFMAIEAPIERFIKRRALKVGGYYHEDPFFRNVVRLSHHAGYQPGGDEGIEGAPEDGFPLPTVAMPWPLAFQPESDAQVDEWMAYAFARDLPRDPGAVLMAAYRVHREGILEVCERDDTPCELQASKGRSLYFSVYRNYTFAIQPGGDTPTRRGFFDALLCGTVPIVFAPEAPVAGRSDLKPTHPSLHYGPLYSRFFGDIEGWGDDWLSKVALVAADEEDAMRLVRETSPRRVKELRENMRRIIPRLLFWDHTAPQELAEKTSVYRGQGIVPRALTLLAEDLDDRRAAAAEQAAESAAERKARALGAARLLRGG